MVSVSYSSQNQVLLYGTSLQTGLNV